MASDSFTRSASTEWGLADTAGPIRPTARAANFNVGGGTGNIVLPSNGATRGVRLDDVNVRDVDVRVRVRTDKMPAGTNSQMLAYLVTRSNGTSAYRPKIIAYPDGTVTVHSGVMINGAESSMGNSVTVPGLTYAANKFIWLRALVTGVNRPLSGSRPGPTAPPNPPTGSSPRPTPRPRCSLPAASACTPT
jgi:hypothetical protein